MDNYKKYKNTKRCIVCGIVKILDKNYRIVNKVTGYTSKTCYSCEQLAITNSENNVRKTKGYIYLIFDSAFPTYIKIGYTTNYKTRLRQYNQCRPLDTCSYVYVSRSLINIISIEEKILQRISTYAYSTPNRNEWFSIEYKEKLIEEIKLAEADINNRPKNLF